MSNQIFSFAFCENQNIRTTLIDEEPWFVAKDLCVSLGYTNTSEALRKHVFKEDITKRDTPTQSGNQNMLWVNEAGLYGLIFGSKLEGAEKFKWWVQHEVLPAIRKHGSYIKEQENLKFDVKKPWYVEQLLELLKHYTVSEAALKKVIDITERAWKQGYAVAMAKVEKEQAEQKGADTKDDSGTINVKFSTVLNMLFIANYISSKFEYYTEAVHLMNEVMQKLEIVKNDTESLCALGDMKMPLLCGELKRLSYTEDQQRLVDKTLYPWRRDKKEEKAA